MNEITFLLSFALLLLLAIGIVCYPLRQSKPLAMFILPLFTVLALLGYRHWGGWFALKDFHQQQERQQKANAVLASIKSPEELIAKMKARLNDNPDSARGWYLLGRLYASLGQWQEARDAYKKSRQLNPDDDVAEINYIQSLWQLNGRTMNTHLQRLLDDLLKKHPQQADALAFTAMNAYQQKDFKTAIHYWEQLLAMVPETSEEAQSLRKAIAKARQQV